MAAPNIVNVADILGKTSVLDVTTTITAIVENSAASGEVYKINSLIVSNIDGTNACDVTVDLFRSSTSYKLASTITIPADATLVVISKETSIYLEEGDSLRVQASANSDLQAVSSYEVIS
jgi:uncharacterized protein YajQ (UPF0234 family)